MLTAACLVVVIAGLKLAASVVVPFLLSLFIAMLGIPPLSWLRSKRVPSSLAVLIVILAILGLFVGIGALVGSSASAFGGQFPQYQKALEGYLTQTAEWFEEFGGISVKDIRTELVSLLSSARAIEFIRTTFSNLTALLSNFVLVLLTTIFILAEAADFPAKLRAALGGPESDLTRFRPIMTQIQKYLLIKTLVSLATGAAVWIWLWILGVDFAVLWGLVAFLLNYIPNLGSIIAAVPPFLLALIQPHGGIGLALAVAAGFIAVNMILGNFVEPHFMGQRLGLSTLVVFLSLAFWAFVLGGVGMLLSVPLTMIVKILMQNSDDLRWLAVLLDSTPPPRKAAAGD